MLANSNNTVQRTRSRLQTGETNKETKRVEVVGICRVSQEQLPGFFEGVKKEFVSPYRRLDSIPKIFEQVVLRKLIKASTMLKLS
jgi:hypothetical protein